MGYLCRLAKISYKMSIDNTENVFKNLYFSRKWKQRKTQILLC